MDDAEDAKDAEEEEDAKEEKDESRCDRIHVAVRVINSRPNAMHGQRKHIDISVPEQCSMGNAASVITSMDSS